eukprot:TRINITY_DN12849_c0_g1_i11.p1 TRINITY_DN12849_c0_g1~~TRINITY_DN12849_c0_g1_i11.p1  ORF type:complete len:413 (+),score=106.25 TRINITY_DN12849_c0_g1_i11:171-1409(+)
MAARCHWTMLDVAARGGGGLAPAVGPPASAASPAPEERRRFHFIFGADAQGGAYIVATVTHPRFATLRQLKNFAEQSLRRRLPALALRCPSGADFVVAIQVLHEGCSRWYPLVADGQLRAVKADRPMRIWLYVNMSTYKGPLSGAPSVADFQARAIYGAVARKGGTFTLDALTDYCKANSIDWMGALYGGAIEEAFDEQPTGGADGNSGSKNEADPKRRRLLREVPLGVWLRAVRKVSRSHEAALDGLFHAPRLGAACGDQHMGYARSPKEAEVPSFAYRVSRQFMLQEPNSPPAPPAALLRGMRARPSAAELRNVENLKQRLAEAEGLSRPAQRLQMGWDLDGTTATATALSVVQHDVTEGLRLWGDAWVSRYTPGMLGDPDEPAAPDEDVPLVDEEVGTPSVLLGDGDLQ